MPVGRRHARWASALPRRLSGNPYGDGLAAQKANYDIGLVAHKANYDISLVAHKANYGIGLVRHKDGMFWPCGTQGRI